MCFFTDGSSFWATISPYLTCWSSHPFLSVSLSINLQCLFIYIYLTARLFLLLCTWLPLYPPAHIIYLFFVFFFTFRPAPFIYLLPSQYPIWQVRTVNQIVRYVQGCSYTSKILRIKADIKVKLVAAESWDIFRRRWWRPNYSLKESEYKMYNWWYGMIVSAQCAESRHSFRFLLASLCLSWFRLAGVSVSCWWPAPCGRMVPAKTQKVYFSVGEATPALQEQQLSGWWNRRITGSNPEPGWWAPPGSGRKRGWYCHYQQSNDRDSGTSFTYNDTSNSDAASENPPTFF